MSVSLEETIAKLGEARKRGILGFCGIKLSHISKLLSELQERRKQTEIIRCKDCKHWKQQTNYKGVLLSFGFCESDDMWRSLYGETYDVSHIDTDDDFYCGYAERRTDDDT